MTNSKVKLIGLSGASSSGKTTVSKILTAILPNSKLIHQDDFYLPDDQIPFDKELNDQNWDCPAAFDMEKFKATLKKLKSSQELQYSTKEKQSSDDIVKSKLSQDDIRDINELVKLNGKKLNEYKIILIDGFLMYHDQELLDILDLKLFFKTSYETLRQRRSKREYVIDNGVWVDPPLYFEQFVWPNYFKYNKGIFKAGEERVKETGGELNEFAKSNDIVAFQNDDSSNLKLLIDEILKYILDKL
ncbi:unnamed protein product [Ambrosiozyma monospora]|uniref:Unnamed protein product n=1 Tax=Ambrosiozyma monospora TaxID=43982 RepID=A0ACB5STX9_AMBMO|nr:unnamed protein product [Ambrosiozyma monospora]